MADKAKPAEKSKADKKAEPEPAKAKAKKDGTRETVESIVIAFVFAFLFRTFEAEAFVIPTGSMAPTLLGRHKDELCPKCGFTWTIGASEELDRESSSYLVGRIDRAICPNCRYRKEVRNDPVFVGDRILVTKFSFEIGDPDRYDVTVFKFPEDPTTNYIKRLCGLPNETIEIRQGDLYRIDKDGKPEILRKKTGAKQRAVLQTVYDDDHPSRELLETGWPERWAPVAKDDGPEAVAGWSIEADGWKADPQARTYHLAAGAKPHALRYRNFVPTEDDWRDAKNGRHDPKARLVLDFCGYNAVMPGGPLDEGVYWVGDLAVSATVNVEQVNPNGRLVLELVEGSRRYRCTLDPNAGKATLSYADVLDDGETSRVLSDAPVDFKGTGEHDLTFANVDDRLWLWIDGDEVSFPTAAYPPFGDAVIQRPTRDDLTPAGITAENLAATVSHLTIQRDVYYRAEFADESRGNPRFDHYSRREANSLTNEEQLHAAASDPEVYGDIYARNVPWLQPGGGRQFRLALGPDEYLLLGDNSPRSLDGRLWSNLRGAGHRHAVPRNALVGKALLIFWPHGLRWGNKDENGIPHGWTIRGLDPIFYHRKGRYDINGHVVPDGIAADYPAHGLPFYPDFERIFRRIR